MPAQLNHLIVYSRDSQASARFLASLLGLPEPTRFGPFSVVTTANGVNLDFIDADGEIASQHYAFLISEAEFDDIFARIKMLELPFWADPGKHRPGRINHGDDGRGVYFEDPDGHFLEILTRPYGSGVKNQGA
jgi:catechol 2,3-dioxygenase-like lactoylglutathione lyase family enzyme